MRPKFSAEREAFLELFTAKFTESIERSQRSLLKAVLADFMTTLKTDDGLIKSTVENQILVGQLDKVYTRFLKSEGVRMLSEFIRDTKEMFNSNARYFAEMSDLDAEEFLKVLKTSRESIFASIGYDIKKDKIITGGRLDTIFRDKTPLNAIKLQVNSAIANNLPLLEASADVSIVTIGDAKTLGSLTKHFNSNLPDPFYQFDRKAGESLSHDLKFNFAIYQGGLIGTSRPFCQVRNNHVYSREEIAKFGTPNDAFGGYSNKSTGDFQGRKTPYDPFRDLGGYNCRHALDWISDALAFRLRPDLRPAEVAA